MLKEFLTYNQGQHLFFKEASVLLGVSGGVDSVVMTHLFHHIKNEFELKLTIAHCNFGLREKEADLDEKFVAKLADACGLRFFSRQFDTKSFAAEKGISIQMAARKLRFDWFRQLMRENQINLLALAQHRDDQAETLLLNLVRGTGLSGLRGILPRRGKIIRPLLFAGKNQILQYARENQLKWREDSSNALNYYRRNFIRNKVIPLLREINPNLDRGLFFTAERFREAEKLFRVHHQKILSKVCFREKDSIRIQIQALQKKAAASLHLYEILKKYGFNYYQSREIFQSAAKRTGLVFDSASHRLVKNRDEWIIAPLPSPIEQANEQWLISPETSSLGIPGFSFTFEKIENNRHFILPTDALTAALDADLLKFPLLLRKWEPGDYFYPLGMTQKKKISDFLIDRKVALNLKNRVRLLCSAGQVVWVVGMRQDERFKITEKTQRILLIQVTDC